MKNRDCKNTVRNIKVKNTLKDRKVSKVFINENEEPRTNIIDNISETVY